MREVKFVSAVKPFVWKPRLGLLRIIRLELFVIVDTCSQIVCDVQKLKLGRVYVHDLSLFLTRLDSVFLPKMGDEVLSDKLHIVSV